MAWFVLVCGFMGAVGVFWKAMKGALKVAKQVDHVVTIVPVVIAMAEQFDRNGGTSIRDQIDQIQTSTAQSAASAKVSAAQSATAAAQAKVAAERAAQAARVAQEQAKIAAEDRQEQRTLLGALGDMFTHLHATEIDLLGGLEHGHEEIKKEIADSQEKERTDV